MISVIEGDIRFDRMMIPTDWRYSAALVGLYRYLEFLGRKDDEKYYRIDKKANALCYSSKDVGMEAEEKYYLFAEEYFREDMHHTRIEEILSEEGDLSQERAKEVNEKLSANTVMKTLFKGYKCSQENREDILNLIEDHRLEIIKNTFRMMKKGYANFANPNLMRREQGEVCRLAGFHIDMGRKTGAISYNFDFSTFCGRDETEFDFIPFGFTKNPEAIFINNNFSIEDMIQSNNRIHKDLQEKEDGEGSRKNSIDFRNLLFFTTKKGAAYIDYDVEIILKNRDHSYYETMMVRKEAIDVFKIIDHMEEGKVEQERSLIQALNSPCRLSNGEYLNLMPVTVHHILNHIYLDDVIETLLKEKSREDRYTHGFLINQLIRINYVLYKKGDYFVSKDMAMMKASSSAKEVVKSLIQHQAENKIKSYRQKLISCLVFKNYSRFMEIMLQLSSYSQVPMSFLYDLAKDFESNKNVAYVFVNGLENFKVEKGENKDEK